MAITAANTAVLRERATKLATKLEQSANNTTFLTVDNAELVAFARDCVSALDAISEFYPNTGAYDRVYQGEAVVLKNSAGTTIGASGTAQVANGVLGSVNGPASTALVPNAGTVAVQNSAGASIDPAAVATVAAGLVSNVRLASTKAGVTNGVAISGATVTGTFVSTITPTVVAGVITSIALA